MSGTSTVPSNINVNKKINQKWKGLAFVTKVCVL